MRATRTNETALVGAARAGDRRALDELTATYLPFVYTIVRRALGGGPDVDDVVQEIMLRAVRQLRMLQEPESFRPWLAAIAVHQVGTYLQREQRAAVRVAALDELAEAPDDDADVEGPTLLRVELTNQRRQVARASVWIDAEDRALLSLWWLEVAGELNRTELAAALGLNIAHTGVRVQRMRQQLELSRGIVAALSARRRCAELATVVQDWDGTPSPLWRKRIGRHTRSCPVCARVAAGMVPTERLLLGLNLLPVPITVTAALAMASKSGIAAVSTATLAGAGAKAGLVSQLAQAINAHRVAATLAAGVLVVGSVVATTQLLPETPPAPPQATVVPPPTTRPVVASATLTTATRAPATTTTRASVATTSAPATVKLALGPLSLESTNAAGQYLSTAADLGVLVSLSPSSPQPDRNQATFEVVAGLADAACYSLRAPDGRYLRHSQWRLRLDSADGTVLFREDATFCPRRGAVAGSIQLESFNYRGRFVRHVDDKLWVDPSDGSTAFQGDSSFRIRPPLA